MRIPSQFNRQVFSNGSTGGIQSRGLANKGGAGLANLGGNLAQSAGNLAYAFSYAQHQRDQINAHLDQLAQRTGAYSLSLQGQSDMQADMLDLQDQIKKQSNTDPRFWTVTISNEDGEPIQVSPDDGAKLLLQRRYDKALLDADQFYGPEAKAHVAMQLEQQTFNNLSKFRSETLTLRHDKQLADWQSVATRLENVAADPTNAFREHAKLDLQDHIESGLKAGLFTPTQGVKMQEATKASIGEKYWTQYALRNPQEFLSLVNRQNENPQPGGGRLPGPATLPEDLDSTKLPEYTKIAFGSLANRQAITDREQKETDQKIAASQKQTYADLFSRVLQGQSVAGELPGLIQGNGLEVEQANNLRAVEHTLKVQQAEDPTLKKISALALFDYTKQITQAKFTDGNLSDIEDHVTDDLKDGKMIPTDAQTILGQLRDAEGYQQSEAKQAQNQRVQTAHKNLMSALTTTGPLDKYDALSEEAKTNADQYFWNAMGKNPNQDPWKLKADIEQIWNPVLADRKKIIGDQAQTLFDEAKVQTMVQTGALTRAGAKAIRDRQENEKGRKIVTDFLSTYKPPEPSFLEKMGQTFKNLGQVGSSFFQDPEETPQ